MAWLAYLVLGSAVILIAAELACLALRQSSAAHRHFCRFAAFTAVLVMAVLPFTTAARVDLWRDHVAVAAGVGIAAEYLGDPVSIPTGSQPDAAALIAYALGCVSSLLLLRLVRRLVRTFVRGRNASSSTEAALLSSQLAERLRIARRVTTRESRDVIVPETYGLIRPVILLPQGLVRACAGLELCLLHELVHVRRLDWLAQLTAQAVTALFWFNPLCWYALRRLQREAELACDDGVLQLGCTPSQYADQLLFVSSLLPRKRDAFRPVIAMASSSSRLEERIRSILNPATHRRRITVITKLVMATATCALGVAIALIAAPSDQPAGMSAKKEGNSAGSGKPEADQKVRRLNEDEVILDGKLYRRHGSKPPAPPAPPPPGAAKEKKRVPPPPPPPAPAAHYRSNFTQVPAGEPAARSAHAAKTVRVGGQVQRLKLATRSEVPVYPPQMKQLGIEGDVVLQVRIGESGDVLDIQLVEAPHGDLAEAAMNAVGKWKYAPTYLSGEPVEVLTQVTVSFSLQR